MSTKFFNTTIKRLSKSTPDCVLIEFDIPIDLQASFSFIQGQYLTVSAQIDGEEVRRSYSLCSSPDDRQWMVAVKKVDGGKFSTYANTVLKVGDSIDILPPLGNFHIPIRPNVKRNYVAFAAGSGITPIYSIIKTHLQKESKSTFYLFFVNKSTSSIILKNEIEGLKNKFMSRFQVFHILTQEDRNLPLLFGRIDTGKMNDIFNRILINTKIDHFFVCGPDEMVFYIKKYLEERKFDQKSIHFELFNTGQIPSAKTKKEIYPLNGERTTYQIKAKEGGTFFQYEMKSNQVSILDAALEHNFDIPYACKGGVCCTCKALLVKGKVEHNVHYGLESDELEAGYILTCQAHPTTKTVELDFDF